MERSKELTDEDTKALEIKHLDFVVGEAGDDIQIKSDGTSNGTKILVNGKELKVSAILYSLRAGEDGRLHLEIPVIPHQKKENE